MRRNRTPTAATRRQTANPDALHPFHGIRVSMAPTTVRTLCHAYLPLMPESAFFSHQTAAELLGIPLPADVVDRTLHVSVPLPRTPPRGRGVIGHSVGRLSGSPVDGLPVCSPELVWCQLSTVVSPLDLVAAGDHLLGARSRQPVTEYRLLADATELTRGTRGARARSWALPRIRFGVDSRPETLLRLLLEELGFRDIDVNSPVIVDQGRRTLHPDLSIRESRLAFEYEGDGHREKRQWGVDIRRRELLEAEGWRVVRVTGEDLFHDRDALIARVAGFVTNRARPARVSAIRDESER